MAGKSTHPPTIADLYRCLEDLARHRNFMQVFDDLLTIELCCMALQTEEELYLETVGRYRPEQVREEWPRAVGLLHALYAYHVGVGGAWYDALGQVFEEYTSRRGASAMGQFFTPPGVCDLMARITTAGPAELDSLVCDPSGGSGRGLLAHCNAYPTNRLRCTYVSQDLDRMCVKMAAINMLMHGMAGYSIHCNTLSLEVYGGWRVYLGETGLGVRKLDTERARAVLVGVKQDQPAAPARQGAAQLVMF